jgi:hypothetical protein
MRAEKFAEWVQEHEGEVAYEISVMHEKTPKQMQKAERAYYVAEGLLDEETGEWLETVPF